MSVATYAALKQKLAAPTQKFRYVRNGIANSHANGGTYCASLQSEWSAGGTQAGSIPVAAAICDNTTIGGLLQNNKVGTEQRAWMRNYDIPYVGIYGGGMILMVDRLAHCGGLDGTNLTAQMNGTWPALTRQVSGVDVWAALEIYATIGATLTTATLAYTSDGGLAHTSQAMDVGGAGRNAIRDILPFSLATGSADKGIKSLTSVTLAASTGTAGNFGLTLFHTLAVWPVTNSGVVLSPHGEILAFDGEMPVVPDNACIQLLYCNISAGSTTILAGMIETFED